MADVIPSRMGSVQSQRSMMVISAVLRVERQRLGLSLSEVARLAKVAKSTLSHMEAGVGNPSLETLWALCVALNIPFARLFDDFSERPRTTLIRAGGDAYPSVAQADYLALMLASCRPGAHRDLYRVQAEPTSRRVSAPHRTGTVIHLVLGAGRASAGVAEDPHELGPGDYLAHPGDVPHVFWALEPGTWASLIMESL